MILTLEKLEKLYLTYQTIVPNTEYTPPFPLLILMKKDYTERAATQVLIYPEPYKPDIFTFLHGWCEKIYFASFFLSLHLSSLSPQLSRQTLQKKWGNVTSSERKEIVRPKKYIEKGMMMTLMSAKNIDPQLKTHFWLDISKIKRHKKVVFILNKCNKSYSGGNKQNCK